LIFQRFPKISIDLIDKYEDFLYAAAKKSQWSNSTLNNRISSIRAIIEFALKKVYSPSDAEYLRNLLQYTNRLTKAEKPIVNPTPISYEDYHKMLNYAIDKKDLTYNGSSLLLFKSFFM
jgi:hypothetical protein